MIALGTRLREWFSPCRVAASQRTLPHHTMIHVSRPGHHCPGGRACHVHLESFGDHVKKTSVQLLIHASGIQASLHVAVCTFLHEADGVLQIIKSTRFERTDVVPSPSDMAQK